jgi:hypothetical protein
MNKQSVAFLGLTGTGGVYDEQLHELYTSPSIIRLTKPRKMRVAGRVARMGENISTHLSTPHNLRRSNSVVKYSNNHHNSRSLSHLVQPTQLMQLTQRH